MSWQTYHYNPSETGVIELREKILDLMNEVAFDLPDPDLNEWFEAGIDLQGFDGEEEIIVYHELQETALTDVNGTYKPGYTLTVQFCDGQQDTATFFADNTDDWNQIAEDMARRTIFGNN